MRTRRTSALLRVLALGVIVGAVLLTTPAPAQACSGGGGYYECRSFWFDEVFYPCIDENCVGLPPGPEYNACRRACWELWIDISRDDCSDCPA